MPTSKKLKFQPLCMGYKECPCLCSSGVLLRYRLSLPKIHSLYYRVQSSHFSMYRPILVLLSAAALFQLSLASPIAENVERGTGCICNTGYVPVCAGGRTYSNKCMADCSGITNASPGACGAGRS
ncbi:hypothetical protein VFPPC_17828 [Pochonia chlamydosporia 170]|uniref:Kazal-like domain-containing protein n=1 Tax=Pochonia chlamydosporia 170 TaxID=1380566 RepID=A0A219AQT7_METCM|nr:hypothetical protein VFPPC_17828 [Pochonia chlamydosporia 170]OWT42979.1 hypothetical protein VFPPC_17828 [Pochonia chlamydosporia 170]